MSAEHIRMSEPLARYLREISLREPAVLAALREETARLPHSSMQISPEQGQFMRLLVRLLRARRTLEIGVYTGYSSTAVALELPPDGRLIACDVSAEWTSVARRYWRMAGVEDRVELHLGPALATLERLISDGAAGTLDFAFIDADKANYMAYYESSLTLLRSGGIVAVDNVLWHGRVVDAGMNDADTAAIRAFNRAIAADARVAISTLPIGDGLTIAMKI